MRRIALALILGLSLLGSVAHAQPQPGEIGLSGDAQGISGDTSVFPFTPFTVYVVGTPETAGLKAWEGRIQIPTTAILVNVEYGHPNAVDLGPSVDPTTGASRNFLVGIGDCLVAPQPAVLARLDFIVFTSAGNWGAVCLGPAVGGSSPTNAPGYVDCLDEIHAWSLHEGWAAPGPGCVQIGSGLCGGLLVARTFLGLNDAFGPAGSLVTMPLSGHSGGYLDCASVPPEIYRLEFDLSWDAAVADLEAIDLAPGQPSSWTTTLTPNATGVHVRMEGGSPWVVFEGYGVPESLALLRFRMLQDESSTEVEVSTVQFWGQNLTGNPYNGFAGGSDQKHIAYLATDPSIGVESTSFGALKAKFGGEN